MKTIRIRHEAGQYGVALQTPATLDGREVFETIAKCPYDGTGKTPPDAARLAACWNACHGLTIPDTVPPGALAALVDAARALLEAYDSRGYGVGEEAEALESALAPFTPAPDPAPERKPYGYVVKANTKGYLAVQGREAWFETEPVGWAIFGTEDYARAMLEENHSMIGTAPHEGGEIVPVYR